MLQNICFFSHKKRDFLVFKNILILYCFKYVSTLPESKCVYNVCTWYPQRSLGLELHTVVNCYVGAGNRSQVLCKQQLQSPSPLLITLPCSLVLGAPREAGRNDAVGKVRHKDFLTFPVLRL